MTTDSEVDYALHFLRGTLDELDGVTTFDRRALDCLAAHIASLGDALEAERKVSAWLAEQCADMDDSIVSYWGEVGEGSRTAEDLLTAAREAVADVQPQD